MIKPDGNGGRTSLSLSAETSDHLNSAWPPRVPPRIGSNMMVGGGEVRQVLPEG